MARLVAALGEPAWYDALVSLAGEGVAADPSGAPPTYGEVARLGTALVDGLARAGQWTEASGQARHLRRFFAATGLGLGPIAVAAFDGLLAATLAREPDELADFVELVGELFA